MTVEFQSPQTQIENLKLRNEQLETALQKLADAFSIFAAHNAPPSIDHPALIGAVQLLVRNTPPR